MPTPASNNNGLIGLRLRDLRARSLQRKTRRSAALLICAVALIVLLSSLMACASQPMQPCEPLPKISTPALSQPLPSQDYSLSAAALIKTWRQKLIATSATSSP